MQIRGACALKMTAPPPLRTNTGRVLSSSTAAAAAARHLDGNKRIEKRRRRRRREVARLCHRRHLCPSTKVCSSAF